MPTQQAALNIPNEVYYVAGVLFLANLGTIATVLLAAFKAVWWAAEMNGRVNDAKATAVRAHKRIDVIEKTDSGEVAGPSV